MQFQFFDGVHEKSKNPNSKSSKSELASFFYFTIPWVDQILIFFEYIS